MLNTAPSDQISSGNMWSSPELAAKGMNGLYETFFNRKQNKGTQVRSENLDGLNKYGIEGLGFCTDYYANNYPIYLLYNETKRANDWQINHEWQFVYTIIHAANDAIANLGKAGLDEATYQRYICEAKFLRAWAYYRANMFWQGVPIYLEPVSNEQCTRSQSSAEDVWNVVITDLTDCINNQYMPDNTLTENYGRPSKGAAYALRGMAYMWMARGSQGYTARWSDIDDPGIIDPSVGVEPLHPEYFDNLFEGFTTGEVILSMYATSYYTDSFDMYFREIAGETVFEETITSYAAPRIVTDAPENVLEGLVGYEYPVFTAMAEDPYGSRATLTTQVYFGYGSELCYNVNIYLTSYM